MASLNHVEMQLCQPRRGFAFPVLFQVAEVDRMALCPSHSNPLEGSHRRYRSRAVTTSTIEGQT